MARCGWGGEHSGVVEVVVRLERDCGCGAAFEVPTCTGHLAGLQATGGRSRVEAPCARCGVPSRGRVTAVEDLPVVSGS